MSNPLLQLLVLGAIAVFLILRLRGVLGTRDGFEQPPAPDEPAQRKRFDVIGGPVFAILIGMVLALFLLQIIESGFNILGISPYLTMALWGTLLLCFIQARGMLGLDRVV